jgi:hypothetical protein
MLPVLWACAEPVAKANKLINKKIKDQYVENRVFVMPRCLQMEVQNNSSQAAFPMLFRTIPNNYSEYI